MLAYMGDNLQSQEIYKITPFHSQTVPNISSATYFSMLAQNAGMHDEQAQAVLIIIERLCAKSAERNVPLVVNAFTVHRIVLSTVLLVTKFYNDQYYSNSYIAFLAGVSHEEINLLEKYFIEIIDWNLNITEQEFAHYALSLNSYEQEMCHLISLMNYNKQVVSYQLLQSQMEQALLFQANTQILPQNQVNFGQSVPQ